MSHRAIEPTKCGGRDYGELILRNESQMKSTRFKKVCVLGLGYIGLPTASMFATHGIDVVGVDVNPHVVETLNQGKIHIEEVGLAELVKQAVADGKFVVKLQPEAADAFIIAVPTPIKNDKSAEMKMVAAAAKMILPHLMAGNLVILESTSPPNTTAGLIQPILEKSGLVAGEDFYLAYSPERVLPGKILHEMMYNARVIGGINEASTQAGRELYETFVQGEITLTTATTAEVVKLMENTFRDVNIALANEFGLVAEHLGINVWEAIELANRHPRVNILKPGPGVGGHCIAVDPWFLVEAAPKITPLIKTARQVNDGMPGRVVGRLKELLASQPQGDKPKAVAVLGLAYKADVDDARESPAMTVVDGLLSLGYDVRLSDPWVKDLHGLNLPLVSVEDAVKEADCVVVLTDHKAYQQLNPVELGDLMGDRIILDTRNCLDLRVWQQVGFAAVGL
jgi:UDP-N-acetyl-D-mannosaminuronic acid dehydrogenase